MILPWTNATANDFQSELGAVVESNDFPEEFFKVKVLPELLKSVEFGGGGPKSFSLVMRIATKLSEEEYDARITPVVIRLFTSPDRALRVCLLDNLPLMIDHLSQKLVTDKIFPQMVTGFGDLAPVVREQTVKAVLVVVPKLSDRVVNGELLRHLAKTANDEQPGIRTNTTICLGKIAKNLGVNSRAKVLNAAFSRALRDPFVHARNAALMALAATADIFGEDDCATKMLPAICPSLVDKEKMIRDQANKTLNIYLERVRKYGQTLPDSVLPPPETSSAGSTRVNSSQPSSQPGWTGWAISSFTNKLGSATGEIQPNGTGTQTPTDRSAARSPANGANPHLPPALKPTASAPAVPKVSSNLRSQPTTPAPEVEDEDFGDGWGDMDDDPSNAFAEAAPSSTASHSSKPSVSYDDGGEPDFEGWLNAQAQAKAASKKPLPKGLGKKAAAPAAKTNTKPIVSKPAPKPVAKPQPKPEEDEDDWNAWGD